MSVSRLLERRSSGVLLHPTSLPGGGIGTVGEPAHSFVRWLEGADQAVWQILPLVAVNEGGSPYNGLSAFAGNPLLIDLNDLAREGLLEPSEVESERGGAERVDYPRVTESKNRLLERAHAAFSAGAAPHLGSDLERYVERNAGWLPDYALFRALRSHYGGAPWTEWDPEARDRQPEALERLRREQSEGIRLHQFQQFLFDRQWSALRERARSSGVAILGDLPIFVAHDSADVWANRELFELEADGRPRLVSGVPPDYFSETGQRWGNPLYRWDELRHRGYDWWVERFRRTLEWVDVVRIDHFRGFEAYWEIPAEEETAIKGRWQPGPGEEFFRHVERELGGLPLVAEDLGLITEEVERLRDDLGLPGMRVLQFGFDGSLDNQHLPENYPPHAVAYTGTHDNDTALGWWRHASSEERERVMHRVGARGRDIEWALIEMVAASAAQLVVFPLQDLLGLGSEARMNTPGRPAENWSWRAPEGAFGPELQERLKKLTLEVGRGTRDAGDADSIHQAGAAL